MRKDITKKLLVKENRIEKQMVSEEIVNFIFRKKINRDKKQISYDDIEFGNVFNTKFIDLNKNKFLESGYKLKKDVEKNGKRIEFNMIYCESGIFTMGSDDENDNNPNRVVNIEKPFLLGETEVTQELYKLVMGHNPSEFKWQEDSNQRPVECVTWYDAIMFCNKLSGLQCLEECYEITNINTKMVFGIEVVSAEISFNQQKNGFRLPLEKEWEYAAKAGTNNLWAGTNDKSKLEEYAWFVDNSIIDDAFQTHPVKTKKPNEWGFYDMSGNVYEWCWNDNSENKSVLHGGSWGDQQAYLYSTFRYFREIDSRHQNIGFRVSMSI